MKKLLIAIMASFSMSAFSQSSPIVKPISEPMNFIPVLAYHRITDARVSGETVISPARFREHMDLIHKEGYTTIRIEELLSYIKGQIVLPQKVVAITFDDGWHDQKEAIKILTEKGMSATFYVTTGHFGNIEYMTKEDIINLSKNRNFEIGAHSHTHFPAWLIDRQMPLSAMIGELIISKTILESILGRPVTNYAWPYGYATLESVQFAERLGLTSTATINTRSKNSIGTRPMELERINIDGNCTAESVIQMIKMGVLIECLKQ